MWGQPRYLERQARLPDVGAAPTGPRPLTSEDIDAIIACTDLAALADMRGYIRSYFATAGAIVMGAVGVVVGLILNQRKVAVGSAITTGAAAVNVMEARRRARQWESALDAAISRLTAD